MNPKHIKEGPDFFELHMSLGDPRRGAKRRSVTFVLWMGDAILSEIVCWVNRLTRGRAKADPWIVEGDICPRYVGGAGSFRPAANFKATYWLPGTNPPNSIGQEIWYRGEMEFIGEITEN